MIFTFGFGHVCGCGRSLRNCYTELPSREDMIRLWGLKWSHQYETAQQAGVEEWQLRRVVTAENDPGCRCGGSGREPWLPVKTGEECGQIHVGLDVDGPVEVPCKNLAQYELAGDPDWHVCDECLRALQQEGIEEASSPVRIEHLKVAVRERAKEEP